MIATPEERSESNQTRSVGTPPSLDLPSIWTGAHPSSGHEATNQGDCASQPITGKIPSHGEVISVAVIDEHSFMREAITKSLQQLCNVLDIVSFATSDEFLESTKIYDLILYHVHESEANQNNNDERLASVKKIVPIAPVIILCDSDPFDLIRAAFDNGVRGYIPTVSTPLELAIRIMYLVKAGGTFVPPSSLSPRGSRNRITTQQFTPRQMAVLDRLMLGKPNKVIAFELDMSESSVKGHIQNIMNKMRVTNRTEAACRARELEIREMRLTD
jgi:DNA-binding NarL/FixJ family response regulator